MKRKLIAWLLAAAMVLTMLPAAFAAEPLTVTAEPLTETAPAAREETAPEETPDGRAEAEPEAAQIILTEQAKEPTEALRLELPDATPEPEVVIELAGTDEEKADAKDAEQQMHLAASGEVLLADKNERASAGTRGGDSAATFHLTVAISPNKEAGTVTGPLSNDYEAGSTITLTVQENPGFTFGWWFNQTTGEVVESRTVTFVLDQDTYWMAVLKMEGYHFISWDEPDTLTWDPLLGCYAPGTVVQLIVPEIPGRSVRYEIREWDTEEWTRVDDSGVFVMPNYDVTARALYSRSITLTCGEHGTAYLSPAGPWYEYDTLYITMIPEEGYRLNLLSGIPNTYEKLGPNQYSVLLDGRDLDITVGFEEIPTKATTFIKQPTDAGVLTGSTDTAAQQVTAAAYPCYGYEFFAWADYDTAEILSYDNPYTFSPTGNETVVALFRLPVRIYPQIEHGTLEIADQKNIYVAGDVVTLLGHPDEGYVVDYYSAGEIHEGNATLQMLEGDSFVMPAWGMLVYAEFAPGFHIQAAPLQEGTGTVTGAGGYKTGSTVTLAAEPADGYTFTGWKENGTVVSTDAVYSFPATAERSLTADFQPYTGMTFTIGANAAPAAGGTFTGTGSYAAGTAVTLTAVPSPGYRFCYWTEYGRELGSDAVYEMTANGNRTLTAVFESEAGVDYADAAGNALLCENFTTINSSTTTWNTGWYAVAGSVTIASCVEVSGSVNLILCDGATLTIPRGIHLTGQNSLTVWGQSAGTGTLLIQAPSIFQAGIGGNVYEPGGIFTMNGGTVDVTGGEQGAGIGGAGDNATIYDVFTPENCGPNTRGWAGTITIGGGTLTATGGDRAAGIGCGVRGNGGTVTITGGTVTAIGADHGAGIGSAESSFGYHQTIGTVHITGGSVTAIGGANAAGIGGGRCTYPAVTINGGTVTATGGLYGAGIGGYNAGSGVIDDGEPQDNYSGGTVTITGGEVVATAGGLNVLMCGAGIGGGRCTYPAVTINGGTVTATGGLYGAGIGGGYNAGSGVIDDGEPQDNYSGGTVTITGGEVVATAGGLNVLMCGAGIGGGAMGDGGTVSISGGSVTASGGYYGAGIGGGYEGDGGSVTITAGSVTAVTLMGGAGIGGGGSPDSGSGGDGGVVTISGGSVTARAGQYAAGIGGGRNGNGGAVTISGGSVWVTGGKSGAGVGGGQNGRGGSFTVNNGNIEINHTPSDIIGCVGQAVGHGDNVADSGTVSIASLSSGVALRVGNRNPYGGGVSWVDASNREGSCFAPFYSVVIEPCSPHTYNIVGHCAYCGTGGGPVMQYLSYVTAAGRYAGEKYCEPVTASTVTWNTGGLCRGWYTMTEDVTIPERVTVQGSVNLVLLDGMTLTIPKGIEVSEGNSLTIWSQEEATGALIAGGSCSAGDAGIGGSSGQNAGSVTVAGCNVTAAAGTGAQAIGHGANAAGEGSLSLFSTEIYDDDQAIQPVALADRDAACRASWVGLAPCPGHQFVDDVCQRCGYRLKYEYYDPDTGGYSVCTDYVVYEGQTVLDDGWYVVNESCTVEDRIVISGYAHLLLCDGVTLTAESGITVPYREMFTIWSESLDPVRAGKLDVPDFSSSHAAIGGCYRETAGWIEINGGRITAVNRGAGAAIGGGYQGNFTRIDVSAGIVTAVSTGYGAAIGSGKACPGDSGTIHIYGGTVTATGNSNAAGIGGGYKAAGAIGHISIYGGTINASGGSSAAGIGSGESASGEGVSFGYIYITGGDVTATGGTNAAAIGGGRYGAGGRIALRGGTVTASGSGRKAQTIGQGRDSTGTLRLGLDAWLRVGTVNGGNVTWVNASNRKTTCKSPSVTVRVEFCPHEAATCTPNSDGQTHTTACVYCFNKDKHQAHEFTYVNNGDGTHTASCAACGFVMTVAHDNFYSDKGDGTHSVTCAVCGAISAPEAHAFTAFTDNGDGTHTGACAACGAVDTPAAHAFTVFTDNGDGTHTAACASCGAAGATAAHVLSYVNNGDGTHTGTCTACGFVGAPEQHAFTVHTDNGDGTETLSCAACGADGATEAHTLAWTDNGDGTHTGYCTTCDYVGRTEVHVLSCTDNGDGTHTAACTVCSFSDAHAAHVYADHLCACGAVEPVGPFADGYYLIRPDWSAYAIDAAEGFAESRLTAGEYTMQTALAAGDRIRVVRVQNNAITACYPESGEYTVDGAHAGAVSIRFKPGYDSEWADFGGYFTVCLGADPGELTMQPAISAAYDAQTGTYRNGTPVYFTDPDGNCYLKDGDVYNAATAAELYCLPYFEFEERDGEVVLTVCNSEEAEITVPETVPANYPDASLSGRSFSKIAGGAFFAKRNLLRITLGDNIARLGDPDDTTFVFEECESLQEVTIGTTRQSSLIFMQENCFFNCLDLRVLTVTSVARSDDWDDGIWGLYIWDFWDEVHPYEVRCYHDSWITNWVNSEERFTVTWLDEEPVVHTFDEDYWWGLVRDDSGSIISGSCTQHCTVCDAYVEFYTEFEETSYVAPTCTTGGRGVYTSSMTYAGRTYTETQEAYFEALGHSWDDGVTTPSTASHGGVTTYTCTRCGATRTEQLPQLVLNGYYLIRPGWTVDDVDPAERFAENPNNAGEYMLETVLAGGDRIKVVHVTNSVIDGWYPDGLGNEYTADDAHAGLVTVYFKTAYQNDWSGFGGYFYVTGGASPAVGHSISLNDEIGVNFYLALPEACTADNTTVTFTWGEDKHVDGTLAGTSDSAASLGYNRVASCPIPARSMTDTITMTVRQGDAVLVTDRFSVAEYCVTAAANYYYNTELLDILCNMLDYGGLVQQEFGYRTNLLASARIPRLIAVANAVRADEGYTAYSWERRSPATPDPDTNVDTVDLTNYGIRFDAASLTATAKIAIRLYFTVENAALFANTKVYLYGTELSFVEKDGRYYVEVPGIAARYIFDTVTLTLRNGSHGTALVYNAANYLNAVQASTDAQYDNLKQLVRALYNYWTCTRSYFNRL